MDSSELGPRDVDVDLDDVSDDGNQIEENPTDHGLVAISRPSQVQAQVTDQAYQFQSQRHTKAENPSSTAPPELPFAQQYPPVLTFNSAPPQQISTSTSDQKRNRVKTFEISLSDYRSKHPQHIPRIIDNFADDGHNWRKYGQKEVKGKGGEHTRWYYRCGYQNCRAKKKVDFSLDDGKVTEILYEGQHDHSSSDVKESISFDIEKDVEGGSVWNWDTFYPGSQFPGFVPLEQEDTGTSMQIDKSLSTPRVSEHDKGKGVSGEEKSGIGEVVPMSLEMSNPEIQMQEATENFMYDSTGKRLPIDSEKQRKQIPTVEENVEVRANIIFLDRDYLEDSNPRIPSQPETTLPTVSPSKNSTQGEECRPEGSG
ncbi:hypothetical protein MKX03_015839 [Papaver bracteatum]|nr:hypothetical protein MKX03_015839 [Papaver bracteatum]